MRARSTMLLMLAWLTPGVAAAQGSATGCALHVWPTDKFAVTENLGGANAGLVGALIDEATRLRSPEGVSDQLKTYLGPAEQARIIRELELNRLLALSNYAVVIEPAERQPTWTLAQMKDPARLVAAAPCYAELAIISQQYLKQAIGTRLRTFVRYREYGPDGTLRAEVLDTTATKADRFPAKTPEAIPAAARSIQAAFRENLFKVARDKLKRLPRSAQLTPPAAAPPPSSSAR